MDCGKKIPPLFNLLIEAADNKQLYEIICLLQYKTSFVNLLYLHTSNDVIHLFSYS